MLKNDYKGHNYLLRSCYYFPYISGVCGILNKIQTYGNKFQNS